MLKISCYLRKTYQGYVSANSPPRVKNLSWCLVIAVHMFSCYLHIKMPGEGAILPCYLHRRYRSIFSKKNSLWSKLPWCFYLSYQICATYITIYLHINYLVSFHIFLSQWLKLPRCLYLNYQNRKPKLSRYLHKKLSKYVFNNFFIGQSYRGVCT